MTFDDALETLSGQLLNSAVDNPDWSRANSVLDAVAELAVDAMDRSADDDLAKLDTRLQDLYTEVVVANGLLTASTPENFAGQLLGYARLIGTAVVNRKSLTPKEEAALDDDVTLRILRYLQGQNRAKSGVEIAQALDLHPGTIARKLPLMRAKAYVESYAAGRCLMNELASKGARIIRGGTDIEAGSLDEKLELRHRRLSVIMENARAAALGDNISRTAEQRPQRAEAIDALPPPPPPVASQPPARTSLAFA